MSSHLLLQLEEFGNADPMIGATAYRTRDGNQKTERTCLIECHPSAHTVPSLKLIQTTCLPLSDIRGKHFGLLIAKAS